MPAETKPAEPPDMYAVLGVSSTATSTEIRRAYRNLITKQHPDKGGDAATFALIQKAYDLLSDDAKRARYDADGTIEKSVEEELLDAFGGGAFRDRGAEAAAEKANLADAIVKTEQRKESHTAGFEAWMRARGPESQKTFGVDDIIDKYGVVKGSYEETRLPKIRAFAAKRKDLSGFEMTSEAIPETLEWGQILVNVRKAPISPADLDPFAGAAVGAHAGADGVGVVLRAGAGCKKIQEGDWVVPFPPRLASGGNETVAPGVAKPPIGSWRSLLAVKEKDVMKIPTDLMPMEYCAMWRELCTGYKLLEDGKDLRPGDAVILNAASGAVGAVVLQLCALLKLRAVAVVRERSGDEAHAKLEARLKALGAAEVLVDRGGSDFRRELEDRRFFAKPKLALDGVGGDAAGRLADALQDGGRMTCFGCVSGKPVTLTWRQIIARDLRVRGFSSAAWAREKKKDVPKTLESVAKLVNAGKIALEHTEYELGGEFDEALEHAKARAKDVKVILTVDDVGATYE